MLIYAKLIQGMLQHIMEEPSLSLMDKLMVHQLMMSLIIAGKRFTPVLLYMYLIPCCSRGKRDNFLPNAVNKQKFIHPLADHLDRSGYYVEHSRADANLLIVQNAVPAAQKNPARPTVVVADDTDVLVLCWHVKSSVPAIYFSPEPRSGSLNCLR